MGDGRGEAHCAQPTAVEACHGNVEAFAKATQQVRRRHLGVLQNNHARRLRVPAQLRRSRG